MDDQDTLSNRTPFQYVLIVGIPLFVIGAVLFFAQQKWFPLHVAGGHGADHLVVLDAVKLVNAERAALPMLSKQSGSDAAIALMDIGKRMQPAIEKAAGPGAVVVVKQAVVLGDLPDITDQVIKELNLPTNAPTVDLSKYLETAPTTDALTGAAALWEQRQNAMIQAHHNAEERSAHDAVNQNLP